MNHASPKSCCTEKETVANTPSNIGSLKLAVFATFHCLVGCTVGEFVGLAIGVSAGFEPMSTMILSTVLAYLSGFSLTLFPLMRNAKLNLVSALKAVWLGELISIGIMELVMNSVDFHMGGVRSGSLANPLFWQALLVAVPAGFLAALPVNAVLIAKQMKKCH